VLAGENARATAKPVARASPRPSRWRGLPCGQPEGCLTAEGAPRRRRPAHRRRPVPPTSACLTAGSTPNHRRSASPPEARLTGGGLLDCRIPGLL